MPSPVYGTRTSYGGSSSSSYYSGPSSSTSRRTTTSSQDSSSMYNNSSGSNQSNPFYSGGDGGSGDGAPGGAPQNGSQYGTSSPPTQYDSADLRVRRGYRDQQPLADFSSVFRDPEAGGTADGFGLENTAGGHTMSPANGAARPSMTSKMKIMFALLVGAAAALHADLNMAAPHMSRLAEDFGLTALEKDKLLGGMVQLGFFIVGGACSLFVGPLADKSDRVQLLSGLLVFSGTLNLCISQFLPNSKAGFFYFFICRVLSGVSIGGCFPVLYSLCGDLFPSSQRSFVAASIGAGANAGAAIGSIFSGIIGTAGAWRYPYGVAFLLQIVGAGSVVALLKDPRKAQERGQSSAGPKDWAAAWAGGRQAYTEMEAQKGYIRMEDLDFSKFRDIGQIPTNKILLLQAIPGCVPVSLILTFLPDYLISQHGMSVQSTVLVQTTWGVASLALTFLGGMLGQRMYETNKNHFCRFLAVAVAAGVFPFLILTNLSASLIANQETGRCTFLSLVLACAGGLVGIAGPNVRATLMHLNPSSARGTVFSALTLCDDLGKGFGPFVIVILISIFGRRIAFSIAFCFWFIASFMLYNLKTHLQRDCHNSSFGFSAGGRAHHSRYE
ncbi:unnamed protein product [Amoebophrya sp. A25]|nr:unnamed protein product [Amoebophrya sp. A25]|eukprot:GSA25T00007920001.1